MRSNFMKLSGVQVLRSSGAVLVTNNNYQLFTYQVLWSNLVSISGGALMVEPKDLNH